MAALVGVELGGTKVVVGTSTVAGRLDDRIRINTTSPEETLAAVRDAIATSVGDSVAAIGIGAFGPLDLRPSSEAYGEVVSTPKAGWSGANVLEGIRGNRNIPVAIDTDVNAALLGEMTHGGWTPVATAYLTVGTGVGGGVWIDGSMLHGANHPEMGHVTVKRHPNDTFAGLCPYHGDCLEGMAAGPSLEARFGDRAENLSSGDAVAAAELSSWYVASGIASFGAVVPVERVIIGGGVTHIPGFHHSVHDHLRSLASHYPPIPFAGQGPDIVGPALGDDAGVLGSIDLARRSV